MRNECLCLLGILVITSAGPAADIESDLELQLIVKSELRFAKSSGPDLSYALRIVNRSENETYSVVRPGPGCRDQLCEPYITIAAYTPVEIGPPAPLPPKRSRCFTCHMEMMAKSKPPDPIHDVVILRPKKSVTFEKWLPMPNFRLRQPGPIELVASYAIHNVADKGNEGVFRDRLQRSQPVKLLTEPRIRLLSKPVRVAVDDF